MTNKNKVLKFYKKKEGIKRELGRAAPPTVRYMHTLALLTSPSQLSGPDALGLRAEPGNKF